MKKIIMGLALLASSNSMAETATTVSVQTRIYATAGAVLATGLAAEFSKPVKVYACEQVGTLQNILQMLSKPEIQSEIATPSAKGQTATNSLTSAYGASYTYRNLNFAKNEISQLVSLCATGLHNFAFSNEDSAKAQQWADIVTKDMALE